MGQGVDQVPRGVQEAARLGVLLTAAGSCCLLG